MDIQIDITVFQNFSHPSNFNFSLDFDRSGLFLGIIGVFLLLSMKLYEWAAIPQRKATFLATKSLLFLLLKHLVSMHQHNYFVLL